MKIVAVVSDEYIDRVEEIRQSLLSVVGLTDLEYEEKYNIFSAILGLPIEISTVRNIPGIQMADADAGLKVSVQ